jgi:hypothetical protein
LSPWGTVSTDPAADRRCCEPGKALGFPRSRGTGKRSILTSPRMLEGLGGPPALPAGGHRRGPVELNAMCEHIREAQCLFRREGAATGARRLLRTRTAAVHLTGQARASELHELASGAHGRARDKAVPEGGDVDLQERPRPRASLSNRSGGMRREGERLGETGKTVAASAIHAGRDPISPRSVTGKRLQAGRPREGRETPPGPRAPQRRVESSQGGHEVQQGHLESPGAQA